MGLSGVNSPLPVGTEFDIVLIDELFGWQFISSLKVGAFLLICCNLPLNPTSRHWENPHLLR